MAESAIPGGRWLRANWLELVDEYRFQWLAAGAEGLVAHGEHLETVIVQAADSGERWERVAFAFVDAQELEPRQETGGLETT